MTDPGARGSSVAKLIQRFRHGQASEKSLRRKEIEELMWWHEKKPGRDSQANASTALDIHAPTGMQTLGTSNESRAVGNSVPQSHNSPDYAYDRTTETQRPVQALLELAKSNPSLYKALLNLQTSPTGTVSTSSVSFVQRIVSDGQSDEQPQIASLRDQNTGQAQDMSKPLDGCPASEDHMSTVDCSHPFPRSTKADDSSIEPDPASPSASLREWASGTCSPQTRSSSPADRFAGLHVHLPSERQGKSSSERSPSRSVSPSGIRSTYRTTRNTDGEPYHPLARDYPVSSSAGVSLPRASFGPQLCLLVNDMQAPGDRALHQSHAFPAEPWWTEDSSVLGILPYRCTCDDFVGSMWSPGSSPKADRRSSLLAPGCTANASAGKSPLVREADTNADPVPDDAIRCQPTVQQCSLPDAEEAGGTNHDESHHHPGPDGGDSSFAEHGGSNDASPQERPGAGDEGSNSAEQGGRIVHSPHERLGPPGEGSNSADACSVPISDRHESPAPEIHHSLSSTGRSVESEASSQVPAVEDSAETSELCTVGAGLDPAVALAPMVHGLVADATADYEASGASEDHSPACVSPGDRGTADGGQMPLGSYDTVPQRNPVVMLGEISEGQDTAREGAVHVAHDPAPEAVNATASAVEDAENTAASSVLHSSGGGSSTELGSEHGTGDKSETQDVESATTRSPVAGTEDASSHTQSADTLRCTANLHTAPQRSDGHVQPGIHKRQVDAACTLGSGGTAVQAATEAVAHLDKGSSDGAVAVLMSGQDVAANLHQPPAAQLKMERPPVQRCTADASVQASEACRSPTLRHRAIPLRRIQGSRPGRDSMVHLAAAEDCRHMGAAVQTDAPTAVDQEGRVSMRSTASQTIVADTVPSALHRSLEFQDHEDDHAQRQHAKQDACIQAWPPRAREVVAVGAPDPNVLLAVQDVRAQLEALNQEIVHAMLHTRDESTVALPLQAEAAVSQSQAVAESNICTGAVSGVGRATTILKDGPCTLQWDVNPAADEGCSQHAPPVRINVSVVTAATDNAVHMTPGQAACTQTGQVTSAAMDQLNAPDGLLPERRGSDLLEEKACQASAASLTGSLPKGSAPPVPLVSASVQTEGIDNELDRCSGAEEFCKDSQRILCDKRTGGVRIACSNGQHCQASSRRSTDGNMKHSGGEPSAGPSLVLVQHPRDNSITCACWATWLFSRAMACQGSYRHVHGIWVRQRSGTGRCLHSLHHGSRPDAGCGRNAMGLFTWAVCRDSRQRAIGWA